MPNLRNAGAWLFAPVPDQRLNGRLFVHLLTLIYLAEFASLAAQIV